MQTPSCNSQGVPWDTLSRLRVDHVSKDTEGPEYPLGLPFMEFKRRQILVTEGHNEGGSLF